MPITSPWLTRPEAADYVKLKPKTLANYAKHNNGPPFWNPAGSDTGGRVRYHVLLLDRWMMGDPTVPTGLQTPDEFTGEEIASQLANARTSVSSYIKPDLNTAFWEAADHQVVFMLRQAGQ